MQDLQTKSLWSQISGECIQGPMEGKKLTLLSSSMTTYGEFKKQYPYGKLLTKPEKGEADSPYNHYFADSTKLGIFGRVDSFQRLKGKDKVVGLRLANKQVGVSEAYLKRNQFALIEQSESSVIVTSDSNGSIGAFDFGNVITHASSLTVSDGMISAKDGNASTTWNATTGKLVTGDGKDLESIPLITSFWFAWVSFFPDTELIN